MHQPPRPTEQRGTARVLLVEANAEVRALIAEQMSSLGYQVAQAASAREALVVLEECDGRLDLLLSGALRRTALTGVDLANIARERWPKLGVLLVSALGIEGTFPQLLKPFRKAELARTVRRVLAVDEGQQEATA